MLIVEEMAGFNLVHQPRVPLEIEKLRWQGKFGYLAPAAAADVGAILGVVELH